MAVMEARQGQAGCISIVYARPVGGKREFRFNFGHEVAKHAELNRPDLFVGIPREQDKYESYMERQRSQGYRMEHGE